MVITVGIGRANGYEINLNIASIYLAWSCDYSQPYLGVYLPTKYRVQLSVSSYHTLLTVACLQSPPLLLCEHPNDLSISRQRIRKQCELG